MSDGCPHCPDGHASPAHGRWSISVWSAPDGQPTHLRVERTDGEHVALSDAHWLHRIIVSSQHEQRVILQAARTLWEAENMGPWAEAGEEMHAQYLRMVRVAMDALSDAMRP